MPDISLVCPQCSQEFAFTEEEQAQCAEQAFPPPTYCPDCHQQRKLAKDEERNRQRRNSSRRRR